MRLTLIMFIFTGLFSGTANACLFNNLVEQAQKQEEEKRRQYPSMAPTVLPEAKKELRILTFVMNELEKEGDRNTRKDRKSVAKTVERLSSRIDQWEGNNFYQDLPDTLADAKKMNEKYSRFADIEAQTIEAEEREEQKRQAADARRVAADEARRAGEEKAALAAYKERCGEASSDDPFAAFSSAKAVRPTLRIIDGSKRYQYEANTEGCIWEADPMDGNALPVLASENSYKQNPNSKLQFVLNLADGSSLILDFGRSQCIKRETNGSQTVLECSDPSAAQSSQPVGMSTGSTAASKSQQAQRVSFQACRSFVAELSQNEMRALKKYENIKKIGVTGLVTDIGADVFDNPQITLAGTTQDFMSTNCLITPKNDDAAWVLNLNKGDKADFVCDSFGEIMGSPIFRNCDKQ